MLFLYAQQKNGASVKGERKEYEETKQPESGRWQSRNPSRRNSV